MQHAVAPLSAPVVPSNSQSFQSCINSPTANVSSTYPPPPPHNLSDPSLASVYDQQAQSAGMPVYGDFSDFPQQSSMPADAKPGWDVLSGNYPASASTTASPLYHHQQQQRVPTPRPGGSTASGGLRGRAAKRMMTPRSAVSSATSHMVSMLLSIWCRFI